MLQRWESDTGLLGYRSPLLLEAGVPHVFTTRRGGGELDLDLGTPDARRLAALARALGRPVPVARARQVHGAAVLAVDGDEWPEPPPDGDALVTGRPDRLLLVRAADCVPVLLSLRDGTRVGAVHAGWRGLLAGVLPAAAAALGPGAFVAAIGPCLSLPRFEVGADVAASFVRAGWDGHVHLPRRAGARPHVDLRGVARAQLVQAGAVAVDVSAHCTWERPDEFFSHRRDVTHGGRPRTGMLGAVVGCRV